MKISFSWDFTLLDWYLLAHVWLLSQNIHDFGPKSMNSITTSNISVTPSPCKLQMATRHWAVKHPNKVTRNILSDPRRMAVVTDELTCDHLCLSTHVCWFVLIFATIREPGSGKILLNVYKYSKWSVTPKTLPCSFWGILGRRCRPCKSFQGYLYRKKYYRCIKTFPSIQNNVNSKKGMATIWWNPCFTNLLYWWLSYINQMQT